MNSGNGLHCYFTLDRALARDQWSILAHALEEAAKRHGLQIDMGVNSDASRVLRVPGTKNFKSDPPKDVKLLWLSFIERLRQARAETLARNADTWRVRLERVRGKIGDDGIERVSTQTLFDLLEIPQRSRTAGACRRLAALMRDLGWHPIKARGLTQTGVRDQIRGWARDRRGLTVF